MCPVPQTGNLASKLDVTAMFSYEKTIFPLPLPLPLDGGGAGWGVKDPEVRENFWRK